MQSYKIAHSSKTNASGFINILAAGEKFYSYTRGNNKKIHIRDFTDKNVLKSVKLTCGIIFFVISSDGKDLCVLASPSSMQDSPKIVKLFIYEMETATLKREFESLSGHLITTVFHCSIFDGPSGPEVVWPTMMEVNFWNIVTGEQRIALRSVRLCCNKYRSSHQRYSIKNGVLRNFTKFTGKHLC